MSHTDPAVAFVGGGNMAHSLIGAMTRTGTAPARIQVAEPDAARRAQLARDFGVAVHAEAVDAVAGADLVVLAVKPQVLGAVCAALGPRIAARRPLLVSIAAGVRIDQIDTWLGGGFPIVRAMPNTPALIGAGATGLIANAAATADQRAQAEALLTAAGRTAWIAREDLMDAVTALSGSGPAYFFLLVEALEDAAVAHGLPRETARALATQTCLGAGRMLVESGEPPATLRERVTSPGGTTQAALEAFAAGDFRRLVGQAVEAAVQRGRALSAAH
ncbi:pyrroline-5-carboxylate reductase [Dokdonella koreensis]|uniref:Pyrroline-5-carboxylate reductase n=1 Tax=Dokdonella koreensis DS-123 TaxID=1300342 RepID=A0A160DS97_9GAMM|nr:pyrroline-5-carboxylate reductase [Dokdonella koreensis]ANB16741.1 Pyrroline-5-carboxylate reductase [Dokdonella koreensis DS-123]